MTKHSFLSFFFLDFFFANFFFVLEEEMPPARGGLPPDLARLSAELESLGGGSGARVGRVAAVARLRPPPSADAPCVVALIVVIPS
jgi:hypothetical protein